MIYSSLHCLRRKIFDHCLSRSHRTLLRRSPSQSSPRRIAQVQALSASCALNKLINQIWKKPYSHSHPRWSRTRIWGLHSLASWTLFSFSLQHLPQIAAGAQVDFGPDLCDQGDQRIWGCEDPLHLLLGLQHGCTVLVVVYLNIKYSHSLPITVINGNE